MSKFWVYDNILVKILNILECYEKHWNICKCKNKWYTLYTCNYQLEVRDDWDEMQEISQGVGRIIKQVRPECTCEAARRRNWPILITFRSNYSRLFGGRSEVKAAKERKSSLFWNASKAGKITKRHATEGSCISATLDTETAPWSQRQSAWDWISKWMAERNPKNQLWNMTSS